MRQEAWALSRCTTDDPDDHAAGRPERLDPGRISFVKVLKHVRRSVIRQSAQISAQIRQFMAMMAAKAGRKLTTAPGDCGKPTGS